MIFPTPIERDGEWLTGPFRQPRQMLAAQDFGTLGSIHDEETAKRLGFRGGTIEGPTHFSQLVPLCVAQWGNAWLERGCLSVRYRQAAFEGDRLRAQLWTSPEVLNRAEVRVERDDATEILRGTASIGPDDGPSALDDKLAMVAPPEHALILADVEVGMKRRRVTVRMDADTLMGPLYPFSLAQKLAVITEPSDCYTNALGWPKPVIPVEMISVLVNQLAADDPFPVRGPRVDLFSDQEIRVIDGPLFVGEVYEIEREVVAIGGSPRTESLWIRSTIFRPGTGRIVASMLLNTASLKESYAGYCA